MFWKKGVITRKRKLNETPEKYLGIYLHITTITGNENTAERI